MSEHITQRRLKAYVTGNLDGADRDAVDSHIRTCSACRDRMMDEGAPPSEEELFPKRLQHIAIAGAATLLIVILAAGFWWLRSNLLPSATPVASGPQEIVTIRDGNGNITLLNNEKVESTYSIPAEYEKPLADSLITRHVPVPQQIAALPKGYPSTEKRKPGDFRLISPIGTAVLTNRPTLVWESLADASSYAVTITRDGRTILATPALIDTQWQTPALERGHVYQWRVSASKGGERFEAAKMPGGEAAFLVLDEDQQQKLTDLAQANPNAHLLLGVAFAGAGDIERAEDELKGAIVNNPRLYFLKELLVNLRPGIDTRR